MKKQVEDAIFAWRYRKMILVIEDNELVSLAYEVQLKKQGVPYRLAKTAEEALMLFREVHFNLILCDFYLPDMNGLDLCKQFRALEEQIGEERTPIALVSSEEKDILGYNQVKIFDHWLQKPLSEKKLKNLISSYL